LSLSIFESSIETLMGSLPFLASCYKTHRVVTQYSLVVTALKCYFGFVTKNVLSRKSQPQNLD